MFYRALSFLQIVKNYDQYPLFRIKYFKIFPLWVVRERNPGLSLTLGIRRSIHHSMSLVSDDGLAAETGLTKKIFVALAYHLLFNSPLSRV